MAAISIPDWPRYKHFLQTLPYGKVLPTAVYVHRETDACLTGDTGLLSSAAECPNVA